jgi:hypothetical protein
VPGPEATSTLPEGDPDLAHGRRRLVLRSLALSGFSLFVLAGLFGFLGVRTDHRQAAGASGFEVDLTYPRIARPALAVPFAVRVTGLADLEGDVVVRVRSSYLDMFDENGMSPEPVEETDDGEWVTWVFESPPEDTLEVSLDTRVEPGVQWGRDGAVIVRVGDDEARIDFRTWIAP